MIEIARRAARLGAAWVVATVAGSCAAVEQEASTAVVFEGPLVIPGDGAPIQDGLLVVRDGTIQAVGARGAVEVPDGATVVDLAGRVVMPHLVNVHGHVGYMRGTETAVEHYSRENVLDHLRRSIYYGVGAVQSLGTDRDGVEIALRDARRSGTLGDEPLALLFTGGAGVVAPTPGSANGGPFFATDVVREAATPDEAARHVAELAALGPDMLKLWVDDRNGTRVKMTPEVYRATVTAAHEHGLRSVAHVYYRDDAVGLLEAGVDGFAHMVRAEPGVDEELAAAIAAAGIFQCSTLTIQKRLVDEPDWVDDPSLAETVETDVVSAWRTGLESASPDAVARSREGYARLEASLRNLHAAGARIVLCGDTGLSSQAPGFTEHRELEAMVQAGLPPLDAIRAATAVGADVLGLDQLGTLAPGKRANFIVLEASPLDDIAHSRRIVDVYLGGLPIDREAVRTRFLPWS